MNGVGHVGCLVLKGENWDPMKTGNTHDYLEKSQVMMKGGWDVASKGRGWSSRSSAHHEKSFCSYYFLSFFCSLCGLWQTLQTLGSKGYRKCYSRWDKPSSSASSHDPGICQSFRHELLELLCLVVMSRTRWLDVKLHSIILTWNIKPLPCSVVTVRMFLGRSCCRHPLSILSN